MRVERQGKAVRTYEAGEQIDLDLLTGVGEGLEVRKNLPKDALVMIARPSVSCGIL